MNFSNNNNFVQSIKTNFNTSENSLDETCVIQTKRQSNYNIANESNEQKKNLEPKIVPKSQKISQPPQKQIQTQIQLQKLEQSQNNSGSKVDQESHQCIPPPVPFSQNNFKLASLNLKDPRISILYTRIKEMIEKGNIQQLNLVLDIDQTLISSISESDKDRINEIRMKYSAVSNTDTLHTIVVHDELMGARETLVALRPQVKQFLAQLSQFFQIYAYSHGRTSYVKSILDLLDRGRTIFDRKIIFTNSGNVTESTQKNLERLNLTDPLFMKRTLIVDDLIEIWVDGQDKMIIPIKKYTPMYTDSSRKPKNFCLFKDQIGYFLSFEQNKDIFLDMDLQYKEETSLLPAIQNNIIKHALIYFNKLFFHQYDVEQLSLTEIYNQDRKTILMGKQIFIHSSEQLLTLWEKIASSMGGCITQDPDLANFKLLERSEYMTVKEIEANFIGFIDIQWLSDTYFFGYTKNPINYQFSFL